MIFIFVTLFIDILGIGIIIPILPELIKEFLGGDVPTAGRYYGVIIAIYATMQFLCAPMVGALSDRFGRRPIILASLFGLGTDYLIQGWAPTIGWLFVGRFIAGIMGHGGVPIDMVNLMIASIAIGVAVDDTIHFLYHYKVVFLGGGKVDEAIAAAMKHCGRAIVSTSAVLALGFSVYLAASMSNLQRFGGLIALTAVMALLIDLIFAPALLRLVYGDDKQ